jgi:hypothetical protein
MLLFAFLRWWYGKGWSNNLTRSRRRLSRSYASFSVPLLLRTLGAPWRRLGGNGGTSMQQRFQSALDSLISRFIGLMVRLVTLGAAALLLSVEVLIGAVVFIIWPLLPPLAVGLVVGGLI